MYKILILLLVLITGFHCFGQYGGEYPKNSAPFVQTLDGRHVNATNLTIKRKHFFADTSEFLRKEICKFSDGKYTYAIIDGYYVKWICDGKINVYLYSSTSTSYDAGWGGIPARTTSKTKTRLFLEDSATPCTYLDYNKAKSFMKLLPDGPIKEEFKASSRRMRLGRCLSWGGLCVMTAGFFGAGVAWVNDEGNKKQINKGIYTGIGGFAMWYGAAILTYRIKDYKHKAIYSVNSGEASR